MYFVFSLLIILGTLKSTEQKIQPINVPDFGNDDLINTGSGRRLNYHEVSKVQQRALDMLHCQVLITPFLNEFHHNFSHWHLPTTDHDVNRFIRLMHMNVTDFADEQITAVLEQISRIKIRIFLWSSDSIKKLLNHVIIGKQHTFTKLKENIKRIMENWQLDLSDTTNLLKQAKIYRPPCLMNRGEGSTRQPKRVTYTSPEPRTTRSTCSSREDN